MKNGFTLIELVMVILLLGVIALITVPAVNSVIKKSKVNTYEKQVKTIEGAAKTYMSMNSTELPSEDENDEACVNVSTLKHEGLLSNEDIINPNEKNKSFDGSVQIKWNGKKYVYIYNDEKC